MGAIILGVESLKKRTPGVWVSSKQPVAVLSVSKDLDEVGAVSDSEGAVKAGNGCTVGRPWVSN